MTTALRRQSHGALTKYEPDKGLKRIAVFEAAEKHFARAKDATKLQQAIRAKLEAQAEFVLWWDTQAEKSTGNRYGRNRSVTAVQAGKDGLPGRMVINRWRQKLSDPDDFEATYERAVARYLKILEFETAAHVVQNTGEYEWYTPAEYVEAARAVLGAIDLDPASTDVANHVIKAAQIFSAKENGLDQRWDGRVWMNPPYSQPLIEQFCKKLAESVRAKTVPAAVVLVNNATETQWFRSLVDVSAAICFPTGRVQFWSPDKTTAAPLQGQAILYIGDDVSGFVKEFATFGFSAVIAR